MTFVASENSAGPSPSSHSVSRSGFTQLRNRLSPKAGGAPGNNRCRATLSKCQRAGL